jgi:hypothetical protein
MKKKTLPGSVIGQGIKGKDKAKPEKRKGMRLPWLKPGKPSPG